MPALLNAEEGLCFDDVLLVPQHSNIQSRSHVDITSDETSGLPNVKIPIISSPMDTVTGSRMMVQIAKLGGIGIVHRDLPIQEFTQKAKLLDPLQWCGFSVGATGDYLEKIQEALPLLKARKNIVLCLDTAYGYSTIVENAVKQIGKLVPPSTQLMVGNIATADAYNWIRTVMPRVDLVRVGIGGGAACSTRVQAGVGYPTLQSILDISNFKEDSFQERPLIVADGGFRTPGDCIKALAAGADFIMLGMMLAGTSASPTEILTINNQQVKPYRGMASLSVKETEGKNASYIEGIDTFVKYTGSLEQQIAGITDGIKSGCSYCGAQNLTMLKSKAILKRQTSLSIKETYPLVYQNQN